MSGELITPAANETSRERLVTAARRLFAERGLYGVSLREVIREAGIKHATAIQYHFGGREGLVAAVLGPFESRVTTRREAMLDDYEANPSADRRAIAAILVRPMARELEALEGRYCLRVFAQWLQDAHGMTDETTSSVSGWWRSADRFLPPGEGSSYLRDSALMFTSIELARRASEQREDDRLFVSRVIDVVTAILEAPFCPETDRLHVENRQRHEQGSMDSIA